MANEFPDSGIAHPANLDDYFSDNLHKRRQERFKSAIGQKAISVPAANFGENEQAVRVRDLIQTDRTNNTDRVIRELNDILSSYYEVARRRFVDNVLLQAAHHLLVTGPDTPLRLLSPSYILNLSEDQLENIAGEDPSTVRKRGSLRKEIEGLEKGRRILL
ncbi:hypothetical protein TMEN_5481 [Trichophyton mentagrophytes]|nr:hypothetical protein TMEN_5481 [Trichophyton mentagrophytes]